MTFDLCSCRSSTGCQCRTFVMSCITPAGTPVAAASVMPPRKETVWFYRRSSPPESTWSTLGRIPEHRRCTRYEQQTTNSLPRRLYAAQQLTEDQEVNCFNSLALACHLRSTKLLLSDMKTFSSEQNWRLLNKNDWRKQSNKVGNCSWAPDPQGPWKLQVHCVAIHF